MKARIVVVLGLLLLGLTPLSAAIYMKFEGIQGESASPGHTGWIEVVSFSWGMSQSGGMAHGSGGGEGKATFHDLSFTHRVDKASPEIVKAALTGKHFPKVTIDNNGLHIDLQDVTITSAQKSGMGGGDLGPTETVKLSFVSDTFHVPTPNPPNPAGAVSGALVPAVQAPPNATLNGGAMTLVSLKLIGQTNAIIVVCRDAALQRASMSRAPMPTLSIHAGQKSFTFTDVMVSGYGAAAGGCNQATLNFAHYDGPAGGF